MESPCLPHWTLSESYWRCWRISHHGSESYKQKNLKRLLTIVFLSGIIQKHKGKGVLDLFRDAFFCALAMSHARMGIQKGVGCPHPKALRNSHPDTANAATVSDRRTRTGGMAQRKKSHARTHISEHGGCEHPKRDELKRGDASCVES